MLAKSIAATNAIIFYHEQNFQNVIFKRDALQVVQVVNSESHCNSYSEHLVDDVKNALR